MVPSQFDPSDIVHQIVITMTKHGQVQFSLPNDLILCYGLLDAAKDAAREQNKVLMHEAERAIAVASSLPPRNGLHRA